MRQAEARTGANASPSGCSTKTTQPSDGMGECAVSTSRPATSRAIVISPVPGVGASAAFTWGSPARLVFCSTRLMSGWAMSAPPPSTA